METIEIGDTIQFKLLIAFRVSHGRCKVRGFDIFGEPFVNYNGSKQFIVHHNEITKITKGGAKC